LVKKRELADNKRRIEAEACRTEETARIAVADFWQHNYRPAQGHSLYPEI